MSAQQPSPELKAVLGRAMVDPDFLAAIHDDPATALQGANLSAQDEQDLASIGRANMESDAQSVSAGNHAQYIVFDPAPKPTDEPAPQPAPPPDEPI